jgi:tetratricopeptide (TPR) repeat protein
MVAIGLLFGFLPLSLLGLVFLVVIAAALLGWRRLAHKGPVPVLLVAQFRPETPGAEEVSLNHQIAIQRRLTATQLISTDLEIRQLPAVIEQVEAERLLDVLDNVEGVVRGSVQAIAGVGSFDAVLTFRSFRGFDRDLVLERQRDRDKVAYHHRVGADYQVQLGELVGPHFSSGHADGIEGMLLVLLAEEAIERGDFVRAEECIDAAEAFRRHLPGPGEIHLTLARTFLDYRQDLRGALKVLAAADRGERNLEVRRAAAWLALAGLNRKVVTPVLAVREIRRAIEFDPDDELMHLWLADALIENKKPDEALGELNWLKEHNYLLEHDGEIAFRAGIIEYNRGNYEEAMDHYLDASIFNPAARTFLYLADAHLRLGQVGAAKWNYREALRLQPDLADAHRGYWWGASPAEAFRPGGFDRLFEIIKRTPGIPKKLKIRMLYRLSRSHYRRHPEDSRIHFMLGAQSLLLGDLETAEERLLFANEIIGGLDTEAIARLVLVAMKKDEDAEARRRLEELKAVQLGGPPGREELTARVVNLYLPVMEGVELLSYSQGARLATMVEQIFPDSPPLPAGS